MHSMQIVHRDVKPENVMIMDRASPDRLYPEVSPRLPQSVALASFPGCSLGVRGTPVTKAARRNTEYASGCPEVEP